MLIRNEKKLKLLNKQREKALETYSKLAEQLQYLRKTQNEEKRQINQNKYVETQIKKNT